MNYVLDTNILLFYIRDRATKQYIEATYGPFDPGNTAIISAVSIAELRSLARRKRWGGRRIAVVQRLIDELVVVGVTFDELFDAYAEIDAFSQGADPQRATTFSARNMGKNDLWIAATAYLTESKLLTADRDFLHLDGEFFEVILVERKP